MSTATQQQNMLRKPVLMPPGMIEKVDKIAKNRKISFAKVVREAVDAFNDETSTSDTIILEALAETMLSTTHHIIKKIETIEKRLDESHTKLGACPRIGILFKIEAFLQNKHRHIVNIPSIIFYK